MLLTKMHLHSPSLTPPKLPRFCTKSFRYWECTNNLNPSDLVTFFLHVPPLPYSYH